jgi:uncharacterized protein (TIGR03083 family)
MTDSIQAPEPVVVLDLFPEVRASLLALLTSLSDEEWSRPTVCPGWTVKDVALHLLGVEIGNLSRRRDRFRDPTDAAPEAEGWEYLVAFVDRLNEEWVAMSRRVISPHLLVGLLGFVGGQLDAYFRNLDLDATGGPVSWAGPEPAPIWLDVAREYTERWVHQQQIRDAVGRPGLTERRYLAPVLATFVHALPHALRGQAAPDSTRVRLRITGEAGGVWQAVRTAERWRLSKDQAGSTVATVTVDQDTAWRLVTRAMSPEEAERCASLEGDADLGRAVLRMVSIIA